MPSAQCANYGIIGLPPVVPLSIVAKTAKERPGEGPD
jgi:hypothetical protein